jgi:hypothetical protein
LGIIRIAPRPTGYAATREAAMAAFAKSWRREVGTMGLTKEEQAFFEEAEAIAKLTGLDFHRVRDTTKKDEFDLGLQMAIHKMVITRLLARTKYFVNFSRYCGSACHRVGA